MWGPWLVTWAISVTLMAAVPLAAAVVAASCARTNESRRRWAFQDKHSAGAQHGKQCAARHVQRILHLLSSCVAQ